MRIVAWLSLAVLIGTYICIPVGDPDLWWHITVGRWILAHKTVPQVDYWNLFAAGRPWMAYSWSNEVVYALVDSLWGGEGLARLQLGLAILLALSMQYLLGLCAGSYFIGAVLGAYTTIACYAHFSLRPQTVVWILFLAAITLADQLASHKNVRRNAVLLSIVGAVWANTHLTAVLGLAAVFLWSLQTENGEVSWKRALGASSAFVVGTFVTPYYGGEWLTLLHKSGHPMQFASIDEFKPAHILQYCTGFVLLQIFLLVTLVFQGRRLPPLSRSVLAGGMVLAGLTAVKFLPFAAVALSALIAAWWREASANEYGKELSGDLGRAISHLEGVFKRLSFQTVGALGFFTASLAVVNISHLIQVPLNRKLVPEAAVDFIEQKGLGHPILNEFGSGGYLLYRFSSQDGTPRYKVPIDGRTNVNPPAIWRIYDDAFFGREAWQEYIRAVQPQTILWRQESPFVALLLQSDQWCRVFQSGPKGGDYSVFITRQEFEKRRSEFVAPDC
jgi:hypothetical protein